MARKKTSKRPAARRNPWIWILLLVPLAVVAGILLLERDLLEWNGRGLPAKPEKLSAQQQLDGTLRRAIRELGVEPSSIGGRIGEEGIAHYRFRCPGRLHPVTGNRWLSRILEDEGIAILDCREEGRPGRPTLHFLVAGRGEEPLRARLRMDPPFGEAPLFQDQPIIALVIDDFGNNYGPVAKGILNLEIPLTVSILPGQRRSERVEKEARKRGHAVFLHLPMEPLDWPQSDPGPGAGFVRICATRSVRR